MTRPTDPPADQPGAGEVRAGPPADDGAAASRQAVVEDLLLRGICSRDEAEAEATRLLPSGEPPAREEGRVP